MKGIVFLGDRKLEVRDFPDPSPGPREVRVQQHLHGDAEGMDEFAADLAKATGFPRDKMSTHLIGPSVGAPASIRPPGAKPPAGASSPPKSAEQTGLPVAYSQTRSV